MATPNQILDEAMKLTESERTDMALKLLDSVDPPDPMGHLSDEEWIAEIGRRAESAEKGDSPASSWADVRKRLERKFGI